MKKDGRGISEYEGENFDDETEYSILKEVSLDTQLHSAPEHISSDKRHKPDTEGG
jgi:hypothetical protein